eukprot:SAG31_NODE_9433_length_1277_cov_163.561969_1_plen_59_part_00
MMSNGYIYLVSRQGGINGASMVEKLGVLRLWAFLIFSIVGIGGQYVVVMTTLFILKSL